MTYLLESLILHDSYNKLGNQRFAKYIRYLSIGLFTGNPIKLDVIHLHTLLYISVSGLPSNFIGIILCLHIFLKSHAA